MIKKLISSKSKQNNFICRNYKYEDSNNLVKQEKIDIEFENLCSDDGSNISILKYKGEDYNTTSCKVEEQFAVSDIGKNEHFNKYKSIIDVRISLKKHNGFFDSDNSACDVCRNTYGEDNDELIFCDFCYT